MQFGEKLIVAGITSDTEIEVAELPEPKLEFFSAVDTKGKLSTALEVTSIPCVVLVDAKGILRLEGHPAALDEKKLQSVVGKGAE